MTALSLAARNYLAAQPDVIALLGGDTTWSTWIFEDSPRVLVENSGSVMIVVSEDGGWAGANEYNTARFPRLLIDIWADPTRNPDGSVRKKDAKKKIDAVYKAVDKCLHLVHKSLPGGLSIQWGTAEQMAERTGLRIDGSVRSGEPSYDPTFDNEGGYMARVVYNVSI